MFMFMYLIGHKMGISFLTNIVQFLCGGMIYVILLIISKDSFVKYVIEIFKKKKGNK